MGDHALTTGYHVPSTKRDWYPYNTNNIRVAGTPCLDFYAYHCSCGCKFKRPAVRGKEKFCPFCGIKMKGLCKERE